MATRREAANFIRFQLQQLSAKNAFHEFEHICRQYARTRIDRSVVPATGPVSAGGDQGRDFESLLIFEGDDTQGQRSVFACTLQQSNVWSKLQTDLRSIASAGGVRAVYFFCSADIPVSTRHNWQAWALSNLNLQIDILDGQALSEHLVDADLVWIAEEYLGIARDHLPVTTASETGYARLCSDWVDADKEIRSIGDFLGVRFGVRISTREPAEHRSDAAKWLGIMRRFIDTIPPSHSLWTQAVYEVVIGTFYHKRELCGTAPLVKEYMSTFPREPSESEPDQLRDCLTIVNCVAASHDPEISPERLRTWRSQVSSICAASLAIEERASRRCGYLEVQTLLALFDPERDNRTRLDESIAALRQIIQLADNARFYNVHHLAQAICMVAPLFEGHGDFHEVTTELDAIVARRFGGHAAAELCQTRAGKLYESGHLCSAIRELHQAKAGWFTSETMLDCVNAFRLLSIMYSEAGLHLAALHYAQAGLVVAGNALSDVRLMQTFAELTHQIAECRDWLGQSYEYVQMAEVALSLDAGSEATEGTLSTYMTTVALIERVEPRLGRAVKSRWKSHPLNASLLAEANSTIAAYSADTVLSDTLSEGLFADCGCERVMEWQAFGSHWCVSCTNRRQDVVAAEQVGSLLQIVQADMFDRQPWHHLGRIHLRVIVIDDGEDFEINELSEAIEILVGEHWLPKTPRDQSEALAKLVSAVFIKSDLSVPMAASLRDGLLAKLFAGAPYQVLRYTALLGCRPRFVRSRRLQSASRKRLPEPHKELMLGSPRIDGHFGPEWEEAIMHRYRTWMNKLGPSFCALRRHKLVRSVIEQWRSRDVPEWHIIGAFGSLLTTAAFASEYGEETPMNDLHAVKCFFDALPLKDQVYELPDEMLDLELFERSLEGYLAAFLVSEGVHVNPKTWNRTRYDDFATQRLGFRERGPTPPDWLGEGEMRGGPPNIPLEESTNS